MPERMQSGIAALCVLVSMAAFCRAGDYEPARKTPEPDPSYAEQPRDGYFYGLEVKETNVVFLLDTSGSMRGSRIKQLRNELAAALNGMREDMTFVLIPFGGFDMLMFPRSGIGPATKTQRDRAIRYMERRRADGRTPMLAALKKVFARVVDPGASTGGPVDAVYVLSDGDATDAKDDKLLAEVAKLNQTRRITIHAVSIGGASPLLKELANRHGGHYRHTVEDRGR